MACDRYPTADREQFRIVNKVRIERPLSLRVEAWLRRIDGATLDHLSEQVRRFGIGEVAFAYPWEAGGSAFNTYSFAPQVAKDADAVALAEFRGVLSRMKQLGVKTILIGSEPAYPKNLFDVCPGLRDATAGGFWKFMEDKTTEVFRQLPDLDTYQFWLWEKGFVKDGHIFSDMHAVPEHGPYSRSDYLADLIEAYGRGAQKAGRRIEVLTFSHFPWQENVLIEALRRVDRSLPITLMHKFVSGDFDIMRPTNLVLQALPDWPAGMLFDVEGEYYGKSEIPFCYPEEIQARLWHALENSRGMSTIAGRAIVLDADCFGSLNEVNFHALMCLAQDPYRPIEEIWSEWAFGRFGETAAPKVIAALRRSYEIGKRVYYFRGTRAQQHSKIAKLDYMDWIVDGYARTMAQWRPDDFMLRYWQEELANNPRENTVEWVVADRREALRLCDLSLAGVAEVETRMPAEQYRRLRGELDLQRDFVEVSIYHAEAYVRYSIEKKGTSARGAANRERLSSCLAWLERRASELETDYGASAKSDTFATHTTGFVLDPVFIRTFIEQIRRAVVPVLPEA